MRHHPPSPDRDACLVTATRLVNDPQGESQRNIAKCQQLKALAELFGTPVSEGTIAAMTRRAADGLEEFFDRAR
ncbi:hypothetical protein [Amycolatopsis rhizosphaerae]|uniref:hypothetical protein n=1 Tax=Amycolatopsis rhizosphaerae TaxID=2053003 RepID=UPI001FE716CE|nr:hypothetical protein [Amycolatopsis rhizosphaerae]